MIYRLSQYGSIKLTSNDAPYYHQWGQALHELSAQRDTVEIEHELRGRGDLIELKNYYQQTRRDPPPELNLALRLEVLLDQMQDHWHQLSEAERTTLIQKWRRIETLELKSKPPQL